MAEASVGELRLCPVVDEADLAALDRLNDREDTGELTWPGYQDPGRFRKRWAEEGLLGVDRGVLLVVQGDDRLGVVLWGELVRGGGGGWTIGISLFPEARGRGLGAVAQRLLVEYLFAHTTVERIQADTDITNLAEQRSLEKAGFTREGVLRHFRFRDGRYRDCVLYSILRSEVPLA
jgi:RimJ/RimL family protein N-acetyltransferase